MVKEEIVYHTYKKNVPYYNVGVRMSIYDTRGAILTNGLPTIRIKEEDLRDFKIANKQAILQGTIIEVDEESLDWEVNNALSDDQIDALLKSTYLQIKAAIQNIDSQPIMQKLYGRAQELDAKAKTLSLIKARLDEVTPEEHVISREDMKGVTTG